MTAEPTDDEIEAAARVVEDRLRGFSKPGFAPLDGSVGWGMSSADLSRAALTAALPLVEARLRGQIARERSLWSPTCWCLRCDGEHLADKPWPQKCRRMNLCPDCGNKRCPKANYHGNACTGSNEPGQPGSGYPLARGL